jgi:NHLM bacteriocin system ABC transporter peptidase/ATP-binding protein
VNLVLAWFKGIIREYRSRRRVKTPTLLQMEAVECGAAALGIILGYYGRNLPLEELRVTCGVSRDGSRAGNVMRAATHYGLIVKGYRRAAEHLQDLPLPLIVFWEYSHFLVVEGFSEARVYLNDPALGPRAVTRQEFAESYSGVVLTFKPGPDFKKGGKKHNIYLGLARRLRGAKGALQFAILAGLALVIPGLLIPTFSKIFVDKYLVAGLKYWVRPLLLAMAVTAVLRAGLTWLQKQCLLRQYIKMAVSMSAQFFWHVLRLPVDFFTQRFAGDVAYRVQINSTLARLLTMDLASNFLGLIAIGFFGLIMAGYDTRLALLVILVSLLNLAALKYVAHKRKDLNLKMIQERGKLMGTSMNGLQMIESLKATGSESDFFARWAGYQAKVIESQQEFGRYSYCLEAVPPLLTSLNSAAVIGLGGLLIMQGHITMGMLVAFQSFMVAFISPLNRMVGLGGELQQVDGDLRRLEDVLKFPQDPQFQAAPASPEGDRPKLSGHLELKNVTFGYSRLEPPLLENFSVNLQPGSRVALVGPSGSGKSTIGKLVCGLYEPWSGEVLLDGVPRPSLPRGLITGSLALVDQSIMLFQGTVRDNLTLWDALIPEADIIQAAKDACIHQDVASRVGGYDSAVEEGGGNFSGGQRQRLEIAKALAINPTIVVLDEATSALDPVTEKLIDDNLRRRGCTSLIVAHRLSTIRDCDEIIVLQRGKVVQRGRHEELKDQGGLYATLIHAE